MGNFKDVEEMYEIYGALFNLVGRDSGIGPRLANAGLVVQFRLSDPDGIVTLNLRDPPMRGGIYVDYILGECAMEPDVVFETSSDFSNRLLQGKVNILRALIKGQIKGKGMAGKALRLIPLIEPVFEIYPRLLREKGWDHLLV